MTSVETTNETQQAAPEPVLVWTSEDGECRIVQSWFEDEETGDANGNPAWRSMVEVEQVECVDALGGKVWRPVVSTDSDPALPIPYLSELLSQLGMAKLEETVWKP